MKKIKSPWTGRPEYRCFGCSPSNPIGLHMEFWEDGEEIVSMWKPSPNYQGWVDTMHGGILSTLIDETCAWVVTRKMQTCGYTASMNVKFRNPVSSNDAQLTVRAHIAKQVRNLLIIHAQITNNDGVECCDAEVTYAMVSPERAQEMGFSGCDTY